MSSVFAPITSLEKICTLPPLPGTPFVQLLLTLQFPWFWKSVVCARREPAGKSKQAVAPSAKAINGKSDRMGRRQGGYIQF